jgi:FG-GAP-like repeat/Bacterial Ig-like domain (group 3)/Beta-propeller repeat/NHL repeat/FG-GAP repeat
MSRTGTGTKHITSARSKSGTTLQKCRFFLAFLGTFLCCVQALTAQVTKPAVAPNFGNLPLSFTANQGHADKGVNFLAKGQGYGLYLTANEAVLALSKPAPRGGRTNMQELAHLRMLRPFLNAAQRRRLAELSAGRPGTDILRMELKGANRQAQVSGSDELPGTTNYFLGNDPTRWRTRVPTFAKVHYTGVYPGVDLIYYGNQRRLEYDFVVAPHADPRQVELHFSGAQQLQLDRNGNLLVFGDNGQVAFEKPVVYQDEKGQRVPVKGRYALLANHTVGFKIGKYDRNNALVIDPTLSYATYLGGSTEDAGTAIAVDATGNIYIIGFTVDTDFPVTAGAFQTTNAVDNEVAFVAKLNAAGSALVYATYLGGTASTTHFSGNDAFGIALDTAGSVYICGETYANDFPVTTGAYQTQNNGFANNVQNAFISKLSPDGTALVYSTYLGGSGLQISTNNIEFFDGDSPLRMAVDGAGSAYVVGTAYSTNFPTTTGAYQLTNKAAANLASNAFVAKLSPNGSSLAYSTYLGGSGISPTSLPNELGEGAGEAGYGIAVVTTGNATGEAYVSGYTFSADFPVTANGYQQVNHGTANIAANAFVTVLNATGTGLVGSTYLGGTGRTIGNGSSDLDATDNGDDGIGVALDASNDAYIVGVTLSTDFPTTVGAYQTTNKGAANIATNVFVSELNPTLSTLMYSTYIGGTGIASQTAGDRGAGDFGTGIALDTAGDAYITGATESRDFPVTSGAFQSGPRSTQVVDSGFFTELNPSGNALQYSTYLGGSGAGTYGGIDTDLSFFDGDFFYDIALDPFGNAYLTGYAYSYDFPVTKNAIQTVNNAGGVPGGNSIIAKFGATAGVTFLPTTTTLSSTTAGANITFTAVVKPVTGTGVPTGTVTFYVNTAKATTVTLSSTGTATYTTDQLTDSLNDVIAAYSGDATYGASGSSLGQTPTTPGNTAIALVFTAPPAAAIGQGGNGSTAVVSVVDSSGNIVTTPSIQVSVTITGPAGYTPQTYPAVTTEGGVATFNFANYPLTIPGIYSYIATSSGLISAGAIETVAPMITSISPNLVVPGGPDLAVGLTGNFTGALNPDIYSVCVSSPSLGMSSLPFTGSSTAISTTVPARFTASAGVVQIYVGNGNCVPISNLVPLFVANTPTQTTATLTITPSSVPFGKPVTLTATVASAGVAVTPGLVVFCNAGSESCSSQFNLGSAQLNASGVASLSIYPGAVGVYSYQALFIGTTTAASVTSPPASVTVTGTFPSVTTLAATGNPGSYTLTSTVVGEGVSTLTPGGSVSFIDQTNSNAVLGAANLGFGTAAQTLVAAAGSPLTTGTEPYAVATGDFNGDGFTDFAVENYSGDTVSVFLGNGDGTFKPQVTYAVGSAPEGIAAGDVNGDGKLDLIVTNTGDSTVGVLLGNGDGTFQAQVTYPTDNGPAGIVVADFNNDGKLDIATSNYYAGDVSILLGNGDGTFQAEVTYPVGTNNPTTTNPRTLTSGDFNGDGNIDLAVANQGENTVSILFGKGDGTFQAQVLYPTGVSPQGLAVADYNGDGFPDIAIANSGNEGVTGNVGIMLGSASGAFGNMTVYAAGNGALGPVVADFNGDGNADIAVENFNDNTESVLLGNGDGTFQAQTTVPTGTNPYGAAVGNFNGDGYPDLAISNFGSNNETILLDQITSTATAVLSPVAVTGAAGNHNVVAKYPGDTNFTLSISAPVVLVAQPAVSSPTLTNISPPSAVVGSANLTLTISGTQFVSGAAVTVNGTSQAATFVSATQLTTTLTAAELSTVGTLTLAVVNPDGGISNTAVFTVTPPAVSGPTITSLSPNATYVGSGSLMVTITGTQFVSGAAVTVNGTSQAATFVSATQLTTTLTTAQLSTVGTLALAVVNPDGGTSNAATFTVAAQPVQLVPTSINFGNQTVGTTSAAQVVTVTNTTATAYTINGIAVELGLNPTDFSQTNNCPATLAADASCQISITFLPGGVGQRSAGLEFDDSSPVPSQFVTLTGTGTGGILQVNPGNLKTIAGNGTAGYTGDGGAATAAELNGPNGIGYDPQGNLYIADQSNNVIRKVDTTGNITTFAGNGTRGFSGDGGPATSAELNQPFSVTSDAAGNIYIQDTGNSRIRKVDTTGTITTFAGNGTAGYSGDGGPATAAEFNQNQGARFDAAGNLYVPQCLNAAVRKIDTNGIITTVAGTGVNGYAGDGGPATSAQLGCPSGAAVDATGNIFIADFGNNRIRKVNPNGIITTIAGNGQGGFSGDGGPAVSAELNIPNDVDVDAGGIYIADLGNNRLRKVDTTGVITTVVGGLNNAGSAGINSPAALTFDKNENLYFSDAGNNAVREVFPAGALAFPTTPIGTAAANETVTLANIGNLPVTIASQASFGLSGNTTDFSLVGGSCLAGATLAANGGTCTLQIGFTPTATGTRTLTVSITDDAVYSPQSFSISGVGTTALPVVLNTITPAGALAGAADTTITAAGANFTSTSVVNFNATPLATTFVSATQLTAVVPAALITTAGSANITVTDAFSGSTSQPSVFTILPGTPSVVTFTAPPTSPGEQPTLNFSLTQGYPVDIAGTMTLTFTPDTGNPDNPQIQLASTTTGVTVAPGGRSLTFPLAANSTATPVVMVQVGNVSGTITITLQLTAAGVNVTPTNVVPVTIVVPRAAPTITAMSFTTAGNTLTVLVTGFSTTREIQSATFNFTPASGASLNQKTFTVPATTLFQTWYTTTGSAQYGSAFTYTQLFTLSGPATAVGGVGVTLTNSIGTSTEATSP